MPIKDYFPHSKRNQQITLLANPGCSGRAVKMLQSRTSVTSLSNTSTTTSWYALPHACILVFTPSCNPKGLLADRHIIIADQSEVRLCSPIYHGDLTYQ